MNSKKSWKALFTYTECGVLFMDNRELLTEKLNKYNIASDKIVYREIVLQNIGYEQFRDKLYVLGEVLEEDTEDMSCIARIRYNAWSNALAALKADNGMLYIAAYASEGIISQNTAQKAIEKLESFLTTGKIKKEINFIPLVCIGALVLLVSGFFINYCTQTLKYKKAVEYTKLYNESAAEYNNAVQNYNDKASFVNTEYIDGLPQNLETVPVVSEDIKSIKKSFKAGNDLNKIESDTETLKQLTKYVKDDTAVLEQINAPDEKWVAEKLKTIEEIKEVQAVKKGHDPNGLLNKENGGYTACVYFTIADIDESEIPGEDIVDKGTDAGGAVEVYATKEDAVARCEYLSEFNETILDTGSYVIAGTMVIRLSYKLDADKKEEYSSKIIESFTNSDLN